MPTESLDCPNCGAPLPDAGGKSTVICAHCGSYIRLLPAVPPGAAPAGATAPETGDFPRPDTRGDPGPPPAGRLERSQLASVTLGPGDVAHITQLLRERQKITAIQYFQDKVGGSLGDAKEAIEAIEAGLRDASAPPPPPAAASSGPDMAEIQALVKSGQKIEAVKRYHRLTGVGLKQALTVIEGIERQQARAAGLPIPRPSSGARSCVAILGVMALFFIVISGGCGVYLQTKPIYQCSMEAVKAAVAEQELLEPPINGGYLVMTPGFSESSGFRSWELDAEYLTPLWGADGFGLAHVLLSADSSGRNAVEATFYKGGRSHDLLAWGSIPCPEAD
jgi:ribosomal protein L7/L12